MHTGAHVDSSLLGSGVGVFLAIEGLDMAMALLVYIIDNPGFLGLTLACGPDPLANRHFIPSLRFSRASLLRGICRYKIERDYAAMSADPSKTLICIACTRRTGHCFRRLTCIP